MDYYARFKNSNKATVKEDDVTAEEKMRNVFLNMFFISNVSFRKAEVQSRHLNQRKDHVEETSRSSLFRLKCRARVFHDSSFILNFFRFVW